MSSEGRIYRGQRRADSSKETSGVGALWWLHPRSVALLLGVPFVVVAYLLPESTYLALYRSYKHVDLYFLVVGLIIYAAFILGSSFAISTNTRSREGDVLQYCRYFIWPLFALTVFGYITWCANAVLLAGGFEPIVSALLQLLLEPQPGLSDYVKNALFPTIPGITTLTQLGPLYATVEALIWVRARSERRPVIMRFALVGSLVFARAILLSERLALVELVVPIVVVLSSSLTSRTIKRRFVQLAPLFLGAGVFILFTIAEYFRSWNYYRLSYAGPYLQYAAERFLGYYVTAVNNGAVIYYYLPPEPLLHTFNSLFRFPILGETLFEVLSSILGRESASNVQLISAFDLERYRILEVLATYANVEFNNVPLIGLLPNEFSVFLAPVAAFLLGLIASSLYKAFLENRLIGMLLYPSWFVGVLEISRVYYWASQRYFPVLAFLAISLFLLGIGKKSANRPLRDSSLTRENESL